LASGIRIMHGKDLTATYSRIFQTHSSIGRLWALVPCFILQLLYLEKENYICFPQVIEVGGFISLKY
jgi:hypothetical protein